MLAGLVEHRQQHDRVIGPAPYRYPDGYLAKPEAKFPYRAFQVIGPGPAERGTPFSASMPHTSSTRLKSLSLRLSSQSRTSGSSSNRSRSQLCSCTLVTVLTTADNGPGRASSGCRYRADPPNRSLERLDPSLGGGLTMALGFTAC